MRFEQYVISGGKRLRCGYTTGCCAAAAAHAAMRLLLGGDRSTEIEIDLPGGTRIALPVECAERGEDYAQCAVRKDGGDDIDATHGMLIWARVTFTDDGEVTIDGGEGIGRVSRPGLEQPVGAAAINRVPRLMIAHEVRAALDLSERGRRAGVAVLISAPDGERIAKRTYNPRLGIVGGISILGTTGIVTPMSEQALVDTIHVEMAQKRAETDLLLLVPGNYGETFAHETLGLDAARAVLYSNFLGEALDYAVQLEYQGILLAGHIGKLIKLAGGIFQTHSRVADARMEILCAHAALAGGDAAVAAKLLDCPTTDAAVELLDNVGLLEKVLETAGNRALEHLRRRLGGISGELMIYSNSRGMLWQSAGAMGMAERMK